MNPRPQIASPVQKRASHQDGAARRRTRNVPIRKSYWSSPGAFAPRARLSRRLMNAPRRSPRRAPNGRRTRIPRTPGQSPKERRGSTRGPTVARRRPRTMPDAIPPANPRHVFPSPSRRRPSLNVRPKSIGVPPPNTTAIGFATYAGRRNQNARPAARATSSRAMPRRDSGGPIKVRRGTPSRSRRPTNDLFLGHQHAARPHGMFHFLERRWWLVILK